MIEYRNALNQSWQQLHNKYNKDSVKFILKLSTKGISITNVKTIEYVKKHSPKFIINKETDNIRIPLNWGGYYADSNIGVYEYEVLMMKDAKEFYDKRVKLLANYRRNYENSVVILDEMNKQLAGREEYLI